MFTTVITGGNRGIGLELVKQCLAKGHKVYALCRTSSDELTQTEAKIIDRVDVGVPELIPQALKALAGVKIDLLINNAGVFANETLDDCNPATIEYQFRVNALGPLLVTQHLIGNLKQGAKVAMITSRMGSMQDNGSGGYYGYRMSKAALNAAAVSLAKDLAGRQIAVALLHPGYVQTAMVNFGGDVSPQIAAQGLLARIDELDLQNSGGFWHAKGEILPW
jgi:NAD(P)-dependent dehydrogenase (short-subunit alcohol dehydrogenase family)